MSEVLSFRIKKEEKELLSQYSKLKNIPISRFIIDCAIEKIEDEIDIQIYKEYKEKEKKGEIELRDYDDFINELKVNDEI